MIFAKFPVPDNFLRCEKKFSSQHKICARACLLDLKVSCLGHYNSSQMWFYWSQKEDALLVGTPRRWVRDGRWAMSSESRNRKPGTGKEGAPVHIFLQLDESFKQHTSEISCVGSATSCQTDNTKVLKSAPATTTTLPNINHWNSNVNHNSPKKIRNDYTIMLTSTSFVFKKKFLLILSNIMLIHVLCLFFVQL